MSTDEAQPTVQEKLEEAGVEVKEETKKPPFREGVEWLSELIQLNHIYRVKGHPGLYTPRAKPNKAGVVPMRAFLSDTLLMAKEKDLEALAGAIIYKKDGGTITLEEAFDNLQEHFDNETSGDRTRTEAIALMNVICPDYDPDRFKDYHAKKIIGWYNVLIHMINKAEE